MGLTVSIQNLGGVPVDLHSLGVLSGYLGAAFGVGMVVPQILRTLRNRHLAGVSGLSWSLTGLGCFTWLLYGLRAHEAPQIPGNVLTVSGALLIVLLVPSVSAVRMRALYLGGAVATLIAIALWIPPTAIGLLGFGIGLTAVWPQLVISLTRPAGEPSALSVSAWLMRAASQSAWLFYALVLHDTAVTVAATFTLASAVLILAVEHRRRPVPARSADQEPLSHARFGMQSWG